MLIAVFTEESDGERYHIGTVRVSEDFSDEDTVLSDLHHQWREENPEPDSDSQFIDWLIETDPRFSAPSESVTYAIIQS